MISLYSNQLHPNAGHCSVHDDEECFGNIINYIHLIISSVVIKSNSLVTLGGSKFDGQGDHAIPDAILRHSKI
jgi:hypothetical protein